MRFPDEYIERQKLNEESRERFDGSEDVLDGFVGHQKVIRESLQIIEALPPSKWGLAHGTLIYVLGDVGIPPVMFRVQWDTLQKHDSKDYWFEARGVSAYDLVCKLRKGSAILVSEVPVSFDNYDESL